MANFKPSRLRLEGLIASAGFDTGDCFVAGLWNSGPLGPMNDVMWIRPDGERVLLAPSEKVAEFIRAIYDFDDIIVTDVALKMAPESLVVEAGRVVLSMQLSRLFVPIPFAVMRTGWITKFVESPIAKLTMGVQTFGVTSRGVHEWYRASRYTPVRSTSAFVDGQSCGEAVRIDRLLGVGFSNPPKSPAVVRIRTTLVDRTGALDRIIASPDL